LTAPDQLGPGDFPVEFGRYTLLGLLGEGGMARVFRAEINGPQGFRKPAAVKVVRGAVGAADDSRRKSLVREARLGGLLHHPAIVETYDFGEVDGHLFIAMELVHGAPLDRLLKEAGRFPPSIALQVAIAMCAALGHAHGATLDGKRVDLVHRDLKPGNVLVSTIGEVKVADFGIAKAGLDGGGTLTATGVAKGTPYYMSPEQASGEPVDARSDLFALGTMLHEMVTGQRLHQGDSLPAIAMALILVDERMSTQNLLGPVDDFVPGLAAILGRCVRRDPDERYASAAALAVDLRALLAGVPDVPMLEFLEACGVGRDDEEDRATLQAPPVVGATRQMRASRPAVAVPKPTTQTLAPTAGEPGSEADEHDHDDDREGRFGPWLWLAPLGMLALGAALVAGGLMVSGRTPTVEPEAGAEVAVEGDAPPEPDPGIDATPDALPDAPPAAESPPPRGEARPAASPAPAGGIVISRTPPQALPALLPEATPAPAPVQPRPEPTAAPEPVAAIEPPPPSIRITDDDANRVGKRGGKTVIAFTATAECPRGCSLKVFSRANNQDDYEVTSMTSTGGNDWSGEVRFTASASGHVKYYIEAMSTDGQRALAGSRERPRDYVLR